VYCAYYKGDTDGPIDQACYDENVARRAELAARNRASIYCEDVLVCVDIETGKTLWKNVYDRAGYFQHTYQFGWMQPVVTDGKVYVMGQMGYVYCVDANTGETQWITDTGGAIREWQLVLRRNVRQGAQHRKQRAHLSQPLVVVDGVVGAVQGGLKGIDAQTGRKRWTSGSSMVPLIWKHNGRSYILRDNECIDPATGEVLWSGPRGYTICGGKSIGTLGEDHVVRDRRDGGLTCYRLSNSGAELVWELPESIIKRHPSSNMAIHNGHVYALHQGDERKNEFCRWLCIRLADGKVRRRGKVAARRPLLRRRPAGHRRPHRLVAPRLQRTLPADGGPRELPATGRCNEMGRSVPHPRRQHPDYRRTPHYAGGKRTVLL